MYMEPYTGDDLVKSRLPGENRGPVVIELIEKTGYRRSPV